MPSVALSQNGPDAKVGQSDSVSGLTATLTCPVCLESFVEVMPTDRCLFFYECPSCHVVSKPRAGDCCVFCSYGDRRCPHSR